MRANVDRLVYADGMVVALVCQRAADVRAEERCAIAAVVVGGFSRIRQVAQDLSAQDAFKDDRHWQTRNKVALPSIPPSRLRREAAATSYATNQSAAAVAELARAASGVSVSVFLG